MSIHPYLGPEGFSWLSNLLLERVSPDLILDFNLISNSWELSCPGSSIKILFPNMPCFYQLGPQPNLTCSDWFLCSEGFTSSESALPLPGVSFLSPPLLASDFTGISFNYDVFGLIFWVLSRSEEVYAPLYLLDQHSRFPSYNSHAYKYGYLDRPIVDEWFDVLLQLSLRYWPRITTYSPDYCINVTHDVDLPSAYSFRRPRGLLKSLVTNMSSGHDSLITIFQSLLSPSISSSLSSCDPYNSFDFLMDVSESYGTTSTFNFSFKPLSSYDPCYRLTHPAISSMINHIHSRGHLLGFHSSYNFLPSLLTHTGHLFLRYCKEFDLHQSFWGSRAHFLRWQWPSTAYALESAGFDSDSTLGYADSPGFRCGTCHPFSMFDPLNKKRLNIKQIPLILMDTTLFASTYLGLGYDSDAYDLITNIRNRCKSVNGNFNLLWHNSSLFSFQQQDFYKQIFI